MSFKDTNDSQFFDHTPFEGEQQQQSTPSADEDSGDSFEAPGLDSFLTPGDDEIVTSYKPPMKSEQCGEEEEITPTTVKVNNRGPVIEDAVKDKNQTSNGSGPDFKDQMRERYDPPRPDHSKGATSLSNARQHVQRDHIFTENVQMVNADLVPPEELIQEKAKIHKRRSKMMLCGLCSTVILNVLLVAGALAAVFCLTGGTCKSGTTDDDDDDMLSRIPQCERARTIDLGNSKRRIAGILDASRQQPLCDPRSPGNWYKVIGNGQPLLADTCSPLTQSDTTIAVYSGNSCGNLTCIETNDDWNPCIHGESFSKVGWLGEANETYYVRVSGYDEMALGAYSLAIREFSDQAPTLPCELTAQQDCKSTDGMTCSSIKSPRATLCEAGLSSLQFKYLYSQCGTTADGITCEDFGISQSPLDNVTLGCFRSPTPSDVMVLNTSPWSITHGELLTLRSLMNEPFLDMITCDITNIDTNERLQRVTMDFNQTTPSLGDVYGSLHVVACDTTTCFREVSYSTEVLNVGSEPVQILDSSVEVYVDYTLSFRLDNVATSVVLNPGKTERRSANATLNLCEGSYYQSYHTVNGQASGGNSCSEFSIVEYNVDQMFPNGSPITQPPNAFLPLPPPPVSPPVAAPVFSAPPPPPTPFDSAPAPVPVSIPLTPPAPILRTPQPTEAFFGIDPSSENSEDSGLLDSALGKSLLAIFALVEVLFVACCAFSIFRCWRRRQEHELEVLRRKQQELKDKAALNENDDQAQDERSSAGGTTEQGANSV